jgi:heme-degrading monooxygenase HmoA
MSGTLDSIKYVKYNKGRIKAGRRDGNTSILLDYFKEHEGKVKGMKGFVVLDNIQDPQESIVLTFWENKEDMDAFYHPDNKVLFNLVEKLKPAFEQPPERKDYQVIKFEMK